MPTVSHNPHLVAQALGKIEFSHLVDKVLLQTLREEVKQGKLHLDKKILRDIEEGDYTPGKIEAFREGCYRLPFKLHSSGKTVHSFCKLGKGKKSLEELAIGAEVASFLGDEAGLRFVPKVTYYNPDVLTALPRSWGVLSRVANGLISKISSRKSEPTPFYATELLSSEYRPVNQEISHLEKKPDRKKVLAQRLVDNIARYHRVELLPTLQQKLSSNDFAERGFRAIGYLEKINPTAYENSTLSSLWDKVEVALRTQEIGLVHNDLHGGNIYFNPEGDIKLIDWDDATIGVPQLDLCRALMSLGYADGKHEEEEFDLVHNLYKRLGKPGSGEDFHKAYELTHLSIRLRLAAGNAKKIQESAEAVKNERNRQEYVQALDELGSYHLTRAQELMQKYGLLELATEVKDFFSEHTSLRVKDQEWQKEYVKRLGGSIDSCFLPKLEAILKRDTQEQLPELSESAKEYQRQEVQQSALERHVAKGARRRGRELLSVAVASAVTLAGVGGALMLGLSKAESELREKREIAETLSKQSQADLSTIIVVEKLAMEKDGLDKYDHISTEDIIFIPNIVSYLTLPELSSPEYDLLSVQLKAHQSTAASPSFELGKCLFQDAEGMSICYPRQKVEAAEWGNTPEGLMKKLEEARRSCLREQSLLKAALKRLFLGGDEIDYYLGRALAPVISSLDRRYFGLPGILTSLEKSLSKEKFLELSKEIAQSYGYTGEDARYHAHFLAHHLSRLVKDTGSLSGGYVKMLCSPDTVRSHNHDLDQILFSRESCGKTALDAYLAFLETNGLGIEHLHYLKQLNPREKDKELLQAKSVGNLLKLPTDSSIQLREIVEYIFSGLTGLGESIIDLHRVGETFNENYTKSSEYSGSQEATDTCFADPGGKYVLKTLRCIDTFKQTSAEWAKTTKKAFSIGLFLLRTREMANSSKMMQEDLRCNFETTFLNQLYHQAYDPESNVTLLASTALPVIENYTLLGYGGGIPEGQESFYECLSFFQERLRGCLETGELEPREYLRFVYDLRRLRESLGKQLDWVRSFIPEDYTRSVKFPNI